MSQLHLRDTIKELRQLYWLNHWIVVCYNAFHLLAISQSFGPFCLDIGCVNDNNNNRKNILELRSNRIEKDFSFVYLRKKYNLMKIFVQLQTHLVTLAQHMKSRKSTLKSEMWVCTKRPKTNVVSWQFGKNEWILLALAAAAAAANVTGTYRE